MNLIERLAAEGPALLLGVTAILALGTLAVHLSRTPLQRQRLAELCAAAALLFVIAGVLPLPRFSFERGSPAAAAEVSAAEPITLLALPESAIVAPPAALLHVSAGAPAKRVETAAPGAPAERVDPARRLAGLYLLGSALFLLGLLLGGVRLVLILRRSLPLPAWIEARLERLDRASGRPARLTITRARCRPFCFGVLRPRIVIPAQLCATDRAEQLDAVLEHEFAHARQGDGAGRLLFALALPVFYFHPLFWWLQSRARLSAELIADDCAARKTGREAYARRLIDLSARDPGRPSVPACATPLFTSKSMLSRRIEMLIQQHNPFENRCTPLRRTFQIVAAASVLVLSAGLFGARPAAEAQEQEPFRHRRVPERMQERERLEAELREVREHMRHLERQLEHLSGEPAEDAEATVREGDTLPRLLRRHNLSHTDPDEVLRLNPGLDPDRLAPGQRIRLPLRPPEHRPEPPHPLDPVDPRHPLDPVGHPGAEAGAPILDGASLALVTQLIDLRGELEVLRSLFADRQEKHSQGRIPEAELREIGIRLETTERKRELFERLLRSELESAERALVDLAAGLDRAAQLHAQEFIGEHEVRAAQERLIRQETKVALLRDCFEPNRPEGEAR